LTRSVKKLPARRLSPKTVIVSTGNKHLTL